MLKWKKKPWEKPGLVGGQFSSGEQCFVTIQVAIISPMGLQQSKYLFQFHPVEDRINHAGMDGLLRSCATGCRVDEAFTMDDLVDSISADTSGVHCGRVKA